MTQKVGIVCSGGGMRCSYTAGVLCALGERMGMTTPHMIIGTSGNAGNAAYFTAGQYESIRRIWNDLLSTPAFLYLWRWRIMNIDYLIDSVFKEGEKLDVRAYYKSHTTCLIPITHAVTGTIRYVSNREENLDVFEVLRAAKALPIVFNKQILIDDETYIDGGLEGDINAHIQIAVKSGCTKIIVINNASPFQITRTICLWLYSLFASSGVKKTIRRSRKSKGLSAPSHITLIPIKPSSSLHVSLTTNKSSLLKETFDLGYSDALLHENI